MSNQKYTEEFRKEAVKMALESDQTNAQIAENLGVKYKTFMNWIHKSMTEPEEASKTIDYKSRYQELVDEVTKLKKDLKQTTIEREILKKRPRTLRAKIRKVRIYPKPQ